MKTAKSNLFLIELMIAIFFFSIASAVCMQLFVKAHLIDQETTVKSQAILALKNASEGFLACNGKLSNLQLTYPDAILEDDKLFCYYDEQFNSCDEGSAVYQLTLTVSNDSSFHYAEIAYQRISKQEIVYQWTIKKYANERSLLHE